MCRHAKKQKLHPWKAKAITSSLLTKTPAKKIDKCPLYHNCRVMLTNLPTAKTVRATEECFFLWSRSQSSGSKMPSQMIGAPHSVNALTSVLFLHTRRPSYRKACRHPQVGVAETTILGRNILHAKGTFFVYENGCRFSNANVIVTIIGNIMRYF